MQFAIIILRMPYSALAASVLTVVVLFVLVMLAVRRWRRAEHRARGLREALVVLAADEGVAPPLRAARPCRVRLPGWVCRILRAHPQAVAASAAVTAIGFAATMLALGGAGREDAAPAPAQPRPVPPTGAPPATTTVTVTTTVAPPVSPSAPPAPRVHRVAAPAAAPRSATAAPSAPSAAPPPSTTTSAQPRWESTPDGGCEPPAVVCTDVAQVLVTHKG